MMIKKDIRLLYFVKDLEMGGIEKSTILYSNILVNKLGFVGIFADKGFYDHSNLLHEQVKRYYPKYSIWKLKYFLSNLINILSTVKDNKITHLHYHHRIFIPYLFFIKIIYPKKILIYSHQNVFNDLTNNFIIADKIIALTDATKHDLSESLRKKTIVIPHGIILPTKTKSHANPINFGYVGRFVEWKGVSTLIHEFSVVKKEFRDTKLFLVGDGPLKDELIDCVRELDLEKDVAFIEPQSDLSIVYRGFDVLVLPSRKLEGFGIVLVEAMSFGIPVIVFDIPTYNDTVIHNYNGVLVKNSMANAMIKIIESNDFYSSLSANAKLHSQRYDVNIIVNRYLEEIYF